MEKGMLYGVGVGPGDPELLTLKALRILKEAHVVAVPDKGSGEQTALAIVGAHVEGKPLMRCATPMVRDKDRLDACYEAIAVEICNQLEEGKTVAFITLGDPTVYSTYYYVHEKVIARGYRAEMVPGVPSFCAAAAALGVSLCQGTQRLLVVPASHPVEDCLAVSANLVFMKAGRGLPALREELEAHGLLERASVAVNCGMEGERLWPRMADMEEGAGYFSITLVREEAR